MVSQQDTPYKEITGSQEFQTYEEASTYVSNQKSGNYQIVSDNPFTSPVPLGKLEHFELVHDSPTSIDLGSGVGPVPAIRIFRYVK